jgi:hypothetical protein
MTTTTSTETVTERLTGWGTFEQLHVLPLLFGQMVKRAIPVVQEYHSDLYHDAFWLEQNVTGETEFDFLVRTSGTNIGNSARIGVEIGAPGGVFYRVKVYILRDRWGLPEEPSGMWMVDFTRVPLEEVL